MTSTRLFAAAVGLAVLLPLLVLGGSWGVGLVVVLTAIVALDEYARMAFPSTHKAMLLPLLALSSALIVPVLAQASAQVHAVCLALVVAFAGLRMVFSPGGEPSQPMEGAADRTGRLLLGVFWIGGLLPFLMRLGWMSQGTLQVLLALGISWAGDTAAYFAGRAFGKHKLYPAVSPKKTWEGFVGGLGGSVLWVVIVRQLALSHLTWLDVLVLGLVGGSAGVVGDLFESMLKRSFHVKDSGWIMPGHGGLLDRIDSVLFVAPLVWSWQVMLHSGH